MRSRSGTASAGEGTGAAASDAARSSAHHGSVARMPRNMGPGPMAQTTRLPQGASAQGTKQLVQSEALGSGLLASLLWAIASDLAAAAGIRGAAPGAGRSSRGTGTMIGATHQQ